MQNDKNKAMKAYLDEIGSTELLTDEQERALAMRIIEGDPRAVGELATANLRFVLSLANQYRGKGVDYDDLVSESGLEFQSPFGQAVCDVCRAYRAQCDGAFY